MQHLREKVAWAIAGVLALFVVGGIAGVVHSGPLDPPGPPASTGPIQVVVAPGARGRVIPVAENVPGNGSNAPVSLGVFAVSDCAHLDVFMKASGTQVSQFGPSVALNPAIDATNVFQDSYYLMRLPNDQRWGSFEGRSAPFALALATNFGLDNPQASSYNGTNFYESPGSSAPFVAVQLYSADIGVTSSVSLYCRF